MALTTGICIIFRILPDGPPESTFICSIIYTPRWTIDTQSAKRRRLTVPSRDNNRRTTIGTKDMYDMHCMYVMHAAFFLGLASHFSEI